MAAEEFSRSKNLNIFTGSRKQKLTINVTLGKHTFDRMIERIDNGITTYSETVEKLNQTLKYGGILYHDPNYDVKHLRYPLMNGGTFVLKQNPTEQNKRHNYFSLTYKYELEKASWKRNPVRTYWYEMNDKDLVKTLNQRSYRFQF